MWYLTELWVPGYHYAYKRMRKTRPKPGWMMVEQGCGYPPCEKRYTPKTRWHRYCSALHRIWDWRRTHPRLMAPVTYDEQGRMTVTFVIDPRDKDKGNDKAAA